MKTGQLVKNQLIYGFRNRWGTWYYVGYESGRYWFSKEFDFFSTPLTKGDVENIVYKK